MKFETHTTIPLAEPASIMSMFITHIEEENDLSFDPAEDGAWFCEHQGYGIRFQVVQQGLYVKLTGPNEEVFVFFKEEIADHIAEIDPTAATNIRWSSEQSQSGDLPPNFKVLTVRNSEEIFSGMQRVTLYHEDVRSLASHDVHLKLMLPLQSHRKAQWPRMASNGAPIWPQGEDQLHARYVTLRHIRANEGEVDIDIVHHHNGLISDWAIGASPGQTVGVMGPAGTALLQHDDNLFLAADGTGIAAIARLLETASPNATGHVVAAIPADYEIERYFPKTGLTLHSIDPKTFENEIFDMAKQLTSPRETSYAFFAGEFQNAQDLRKMFKTRLGLGKGEQMSTPYWRKGVSGHGS